MKETDAYQFAHLELTWLHALYRALSGVGCTEADAVYVELAKEIARRERRAARARTMRRVKSEW